MSDKQSCSIYYWSAVGKIYSSKHADSDVLSTLKMNLVMKSLNEYIILQLMQTWNNKGICLY